MTKQVKDNIWLEIALKLGFSENVADVHSLMLLVGAQRCHKQANNSI